MNGYQLFISWRISATEHFIQALLSNIIQRVYQHKQGLVPGFTKRYRCKLLVYYEPSEGMYEAICREKQIKGGSRKKKLALIESMNPSWKDLYESLL